MDSGVISVSRGCTGLHSTVPVQYSTDQQIPAMTKWGDVKMVSLAIRSCRLLLFSSIGALASIQYGVGVVWSGHSTDGVEEVCENGRGKGRWPGSGCPNVRKLKRTV